MDKKNQIIGIGLVIGVVVSLVLSVYNFISMPKVAYVDTGKLMSKVDVIAKTREMAAQEKKMATARVDTLVSEFESELKKFEKEMNKMTEKEKQLSRELLQNKQKQLQDFQQAVMRKSADDEGKKLNEVMVKINAKITDFGNRNGYAVIFGTSNGNIAFAKDALDITDKVVEEINKSNFK